MIANTRDIARTNFYIVLLSWNPSDEVKITWDSSASLRSSLSREKLIFSNEHEQLEMFYENLVDEIISAVEKVSCKGANLLRLYE